MEIVICLLREKLDTLAYYYNKYVSAGEITEENILAKNSIKEQLQLKKAISILENYKEDT